MHLNQGTPLGHMGAWHAVRNPKRLCNLRLSIPIHKYPGSGMPAHIKGSFFVLAMSAELLWSKLHVHQVLCNPTAAQLCIRGFSTKLSGKPNSIQKPLLMNQFTRHSRSQRGDSTHHGTTLQQNLPGEILLDTVL